MKDHLVLKGKNKKVQLFAIVAPKKIFISKQNKAKGQFRSPCLH